MKIIDKFKYKLRRWVGQLLADDPVPIKVLPIKTQKICVRKVVSEMELQNYAIAFPENRDKITERMTLMFRDYATREFAKIISDNWNIFVEERIEGTEFTATMFLSTVTQTDYEDRID